MTRPTIELWSRGSLANTLPAKTVVTDDCLQRLFPDDYNLKSYNRNSYLKPYNYLY